MSPVILVTTIIVFFFLYFIVVAVSTKYTKNKAFNLTVLALRTILFCLQISAVVAAIIIEPPGYMVIHLILLIFMSILLFLDYYLFIHKLHAEIRKLRIVELLSHILLEIPLVLFSVQFIPSPPDDDDDDDNNNAQVDFAPVQHPHVFFQQPNIIAARKMKEDAERIIDLENKVQPQQHTINKLRRKMHDSGIGLDDEDDIKGLDDQDDPIISSNIVEVDDTSGIND